MLTKLFNDLKQALSTNTPARTQEKAIFIEKRIESLASQTLTESELNVKINNYLSYSSQGVMNALAFNKNIPEGIIKSTVSTLVENLTLHKFSIDSIYYTNAQHDGIKAYFNDDQQPKIAIIVTGNNYSEAQILPFVDRDELQQILKTGAIDDTFRQFKENNLNSEQLVTNLLQLSKTKDDAFNNILSVTGYDITAVQNALTAQFDIETQMDKALKINTGKINQSELTIIQYLDQNNMLESYQLSRINKHSVLSDTAQQRLMLAIDEYHLNKKAQNIEQIPVDVENINSNQASQDSSNEITPPKGIRIGDLAKEHETLFQKVQVGDTHYWENTEKTVKIHPEKISVPKVSKDSVELALSAATSNFGETISVRGTEEFISHVLTILSENEKYKNVNLSNENLQTKLNELRGIESIPNEISAPIQDNVISSPTLVESTPQALTSQQELNSQPPTANHSDLPAQDSENSSVLIPDNTLEIMQEAILLGKFGMLKDTLSNGSIQPADCSAMLAYATLIDNPRAGILKLLLEHGANPNFQDEQGKTALHYAVNSQRQDIQDLLIHYGADSNIVDKNGKSPDDYKHVNNQPDHILEAVHPNLELKSPNLKTLAKLESNCLSIKDFPANKLDTDLIRKWLDSGINYIRPKENCSLLRDYFFLDYGINTTLRDIKNIKESDEYKNNDKTAIGRHEFKTKHLENLNKKMQILYTPENIRAIRETFKLADAELLDKRPLDYKSMLAPLDKQYLITPQNLLQLVSNITHTAREVGIEVILTNSDVLKHYEKISPELVEQVRCDGSIDVPGVGGGQWNLKDEDPEYMAQLFAKATGHSIDQSVLQIQGHNMLNPQRKI